jgi:hypothetical protein
MDVSANPWLTFGANPQPPEQAPKLGWMTESVEIDPFNPDRFMYGTGATLYGSTDLTKWDTGGTFTVKPMAKGIEETAVLDLISPPSGAPLVSALGDIGGFRHANLDAVPPMMFTQPAFTSTTSLDFAEANPSVMVRAGNFTDSDRPNDSHAAFSTDGGANWFQGSEPGGVNEGGTIAAAADGSRFVWAPKDVAVHYTVGFGNTWTQSTGIPQNAIIESDRVNASKFYGYSAGQFFVSTNGGQSFTQTAATGLPTTGAKFKAVAGREGHLWLAGEGGLWRSTDSGASFSKVAGVTKGINVGFGKAAPGAAYDAIFLMGTVDGVTGLYRSDDTGATWLRINDDAHQWGNAGEALTGDPRIYGRVYLGTNGRGIIYGDRTGPLPSTSPSASTTKSASATPSASRSASASPSASRTASASGSPSRSTAPSSPPPTGKTCTAEYKITGSWQGAHQAEITVRNPGTTATTAWKLTLTLPSGNGFDQVWSATLNPDGTITNANWNGAVPPGGSTTFGGIVHGAATPPTTVTCTAT